MALWQYSSEEQGDYLRGEIETEGPSIYNRFDNPKGEKP